MKRRMFAASLALAVLAVLGLSGPATASPPDFAPPDEPGPFNVGVTTFSATMTGGRVTRVQVFYPTFEPVDEAFRYTILTAAGPYQLRSALGAVEDAPALPGQFPLAVQDHGGPLAGSDLHRVQPLSLRHTLASHGFVIIVALHSNNEVTRVRDLSLAIDVMLDRNADPNDLLADSIDADRIGISGYSAGG